MCNAFSLRHSRDELHRFVEELGLQLADPLPEAAPRYRIGPRERPLIFRPAAEGGDGGQVRAENALWDLIPPGESQGNGGTPAAPYAGRSGYLLTNARSDKLANGWPWRLVAQRGRVLVPADGFYEPDKPARDKGKAPWSYYARPDGGLFAFAGLCSETLDPQSGEIVTSFAIVTTEANATVRARRHDRMPVLLPPEQAKAWLFAERLPEALLRPAPENAPDEALTAWRVGAAAKNFRLPDHPGMIAPAEETAPAARQGVLF